MGLFGNTMGMMGGVARGTASASMWTGNMIYTALQNARTKKEIRALYKNASNANFQNRAVAVLPGVSKQQLLLTSGEPNDNDVYDYQSQSGTAALDYIWGETDTPNSVIVSGGQNKERVCALIPFVHKAQAKNIPVIALHTGNADLEHMMQNHSRAAEFISRKGAFYDVFRSMPVDDIVFLLYCTHRFVRNSARSIIIRDGKIAMIHSLKYDYYKFPGGGIENGENPVEAMIRETREEAGLVVKPETVKEYGYVHRIQRSDMDSSECFVQDNYYYLCKAEPEAVRQNLDAYEAQETYTLEYVTPLMAIQKNRSVGASPYNPMMFEREARVLELLMSEGYF